MVYKQKHSNFQLDVIPTLVCAWRVKQRFCYATLVPNDNSGAVFYRNEPIVPKNSLFFAINGKLPMRRHGKDGNAVL
jgi:hypothetical protein